MKYMNMYLIRYTMFMIIAATLSCGIVNNNEFVDTKQLIAINNMYSRSPMHSLAYDGSDDIYHYVYHMRPYQPDVIYQIKYSELQVSCKGMPPNIPPPRRRYAKGECMIFANYNREQFDEYKRGIDGAAKIFLIAETNREYYFYSDRGLSIVLPKVGKDQISISCGASIPPVLTTNRERWVDYLAYCEAK